MTNKYARAIVTLDDGTEHELPTRWAICSNCSGEGRHAKNLGVINRDEWGTEELEDYFAGRFDSTCECCRGSGKVREIDEDATEPALLEAYRAEVQARREMAAERAMGC